MDSHIAELLSEFPVIFSIPVQWGDQDAFGHVNNVVYFRWFESARVAYADRVGLTALLDQQRIGPILAAVACNYRRQIKFPDTVHVGARITRLGRSSMTMEHRVVSDVQQAITGEGDSTIVTFDYAEQRVVPIPEALRTSIEQLEGRALSP